MGKIQTFIILIAIAIVGFMELVECGVLSDRDPRNNLNNQYSTNQISKRPFCNAFTGCGRKRSNEVIPPVPVQNTFEDSERLSDVLDMNSEPAIENLMRQILSEAKMYEALQEANREIYLQKLKHTNREPSAYSMQ